MKSGYALLISIILASLIMIGLWLWQMESTPPALKPRIDKTGQINNAPNINNKINNIQDQTNDYNQTLSNEINN
jgi:hypothetical protein